MLAAVILTSLCAVLIHLPGVRPIGPSKTEFKLKYVGCNGTPDRPNATPITTTALKVSDICRDLYLNIAQGPGNVSSLQGNFSLNVFISTSDDSPTAVDLIAALPGTAGSIPLLQTYYSPKNLTQMGQWSVPLKDLNLKLPNTTCGLMYLISTYRYIPAVAETWSLTLFTYTSWPFVVVCDEEVDVEILLENSSQYTSKNNTLVPYVPVKQQLTGLNLGLRINSGSVLRGRTSPSALQVWAYLRSKTSSSSPDSLHFQLGDVLIHQGNQLVKSFSNNSGTDAITRNKRVSLDLKSLSVDTTAICGLGILIFAVDPLEDVNDPVRENNYVKIPVKIDCWANHGLMGNKLGSCSVIPDISNSGKSALTYTTSYRNGVADMKAYEYHADEKLFRKLEMADTETSREIAKNWQTVLMEKWRIYHAGGCPVDSDTYLHREQPLLESVSTVMTGVSNQFTATQLQVPSQVAEQKKIAKIIRAVADLFSAAKWYVSTPSSMFDTLLPLLAHRSPVNSRILSKLSAVYVSPRSDWHSRFARYLQYLMQVGSSEPVLQNFQKILNKILWSPVSLEHEWPHNSVQETREILIWLLQEQMPRTFDDLPPIITSHFTTFVSNATSTFGTVPFAEETLRSFLTELSTLTENAKKNYTGPIPATTATLLPTTASPTTTVTASFATNATNSTTLATTATIATTNATSTASPGGSTTTTTTATSTASPGASTTTTTVTSTASTTPRTTPSTTTGGAATSTTTATTSRSTANVTNVSNVTIPVSLPTTPAVNGSIKTAATNTTTTTTTSTTTTTTATTTTAPLAALTALDKLTILGSLLKVVNQPNNIKRITQIINKIQTMVALNSEWMLTEGVSSEPNLQQLCDYYVASKLGIPLDTTTPLWRSDDNVIYRGDLSAVTGRYYWTEIAICSCDGAASLKSIYENPK